MGGNLPRAREKRRPALFTYRRVGSGNVIGLRESAMSNRVLIVDDEAEICRFIGRVAQDCGYEVATAVTASQFLAHLAINPSLIVLDLQMPDVDGIELLRHLADTASPAKVLIASEGLPAWEIPTAPAT
jgi:PleD family two-component response regulator